MTPSSDGKSPTCPEKRPPTSVQHCLLTFCVWLGKYKDWKVWPKTKLIGPFFHILYLWAKRIRWSFETQVAELARSMSVNIDQQYWSYLTQWVKFNHKLLWSLVAAKTGGYLDLLSRSRHNYILWLFHDTYSESHKLPPYFFGKFGGKISPPMNLGYVNFVMYSEYSWSLLNTCWFSVSVKVLGVIISFTEISQMPATLFCGARNLWLYDW